MDRAVLFRLARLRLRLRLRLVNGGARAFQTAQYSTTTVPEFEGKVSQSKRNDGGNWFTLPPFTKFVDAAALGRELAAGRSSQHEAKTTAEVTALKWVLKCCPELPRSLIQKLFRLRQVRRKSAIMESTEASSRNPLKRLGGKDLLSVGDQLFLPISVQEELPSKRKDLVEKKQGSDCTEEEVNFIRGLQLHEDSAVIVFNKPPGMPVQGGIGVKRSLDQLAAKCFSRDNLELPRLVHRLDRDTSGILVMGKTQMSAAILHSIFREKTSGASNYRSKDKELKKRILQRKYWALVIGSPKLKKGLITASLAKVVVDMGKSERITVCNNDQNGLSQHAITEYRVLKPSIQGYTWLELRPLTGRKHQVSIRDSVLPKLSPELSHIYIKSVFNYVLLHDMLACGKLRVHCAEVLGTPIVGDYKYGWQAHRTWQPLPYSGIVKNSDKLCKEKERVPFGLDFDSGSVFEKNPRLHLHCKEMVLPDVTQALQTLQFPSDYYDFQDAESLELDAPLPPYMQTSWDLTSS